MSAQQLSRVLEATGYLATGAGGAPGVTLAGSVEPLRLRSFEPDAWWKSRTEPVQDSRVPNNIGGGFTVYFKYINNPDDARIAGWQREIWNQGFSPLLWLVSPERIDLYNGFGAPSLDDAAANRLHTFSVDKHLAKLEALAGRLAMETGEFWRQEPRIRRETSVNHRLLIDLHHLERALVDAKLGRDEAQALIGRCIFTKYLIDRQIVTSGHFAEERPEYDFDLPAVLRDPVATFRLFAWLHDTFNGDMFPSLKSVDADMYPESSHSVAAPAHLDTVARFFEGEDLHTGQLSLFPYQFDVIPVELVSAIYEQFVHSTSPTSAKPAHKLDVYYTPLAAVSLVLDKVLADLTGNESVLDLTCGSGVFLVESLRRLVHLRSNGEQPRRETIRDVLYNQVYGVDISEAAVRIAAFSLYLAALELDSDLQPPEALRFKPLRGRTLFVGDALNTKETLAGLSKPVLAIHEDAPAYLARAGKDGRAQLRRFDVIVGNPPWSFKEKAGTTAQPMARSAVPTPPRDQSLSFLDRAIDFAHERTRIGMILKATPFFGQSGTAKKAVQHYVETLGPVELVNLSDLSGWLFPRAKMPAIAFLARHRKLRSDRMTLAQAHWSPSGERSHTIEIAPSDVSTLLLASWKRNAGLFKASFFGRRPDVLLLDELWEEHEPLKVRLKEAGARLKAGLKFGNCRGNAAFLKGIPFVDTGTMRPFCLPDDLPQFDEDWAERPRQRDIYRAPLLLVAESPLGDPRPVTAVSERDVVYKDGYFGAAFPVGTSDAAYLAAGVLGSAVAAWYMLMTGSTIGLWKSRFLLKDILSLPVPEILEHMGSNRGRRVIELTRAFRERQPDTDDFIALDEAVFDLYELNNPDRIIVRSGLNRGKWQWAEERIHSVAPATSEDLREYAKAFLSTMDAWFSVLNRQRMRAEIYDLSPDAPYRIVRFVVENQPGPSVVELVRPVGSLLAVLAGVGERAQVQITDALVGTRELRVNAATEVSIVKPAARRHWLGVCGIGDADAVVEDTIRGEQAT